MNFYVCIYPENLHYSQGNKYIHLVQKFPPPPFFVMKTLKTYPLNKNSRAQYSIVKYDPMLCNRSLESIHLHVFLK